MIDDLATIFDSIAPDAADPHAAGKIHSQRGHDDYSTPEHYVDMIRRALGGKIACDPASTDDDNTIIRASVWYTHENSGLVANEWPSPFYLNPPSVRRDEFLARAAREAGAGAECVVCLNLKHLCAVYAQNLLRHVAAAHIPRGRPAFVHPTTRERSESPTDGRVFLYVGKHAARFVDVFNEDAGWTFTCQRQAPSVREAAPRIVVR